MIPAILSPTNWSTVAIVGVEAGQLLSLESSPTEGQSGPVVAVRHPAGCGQSQDGVATKILSTGDVALKIALLSYFGRPAVYHAGCIAVDIRKLFKVPLFARSFVIAQI